MATLTKGKPDAKKAAQIVELVKDAATIMGHVRRHDQAQLAAGKLTPAAVIAYLRGLPAQQQLAIFREVGVDEEDAAEEGSVLS